MGATTKTTAVGIFVLVAIALAIVAIGMFGGSKLFEPRLSYVIYFEGSVTGLNVGSPVTFRGVKVGSVSDIQVAIKDDDELIHLPVFIHINPRRFSGLPPSFDNTEARHFIRQLVNRGLRAQLQLQSLVTGQLMVDLDFYPDRPARYSDGPDPVPELPAIPSDLEVISKSLKQLPVEEMVARTLNVLDGLDRLVNSPDLPEALAAAKESAVHLEALLRRMDEQAEPTLTEVQALVRELKGLVESAQQHLDPLAEELTGLVKDGRRTLDNIDQSTRQIGDAAQEARAVIAEAGQTLDPETGLPAQWTEKLEETAQAARQTLAATEKAMSRIDQALAEDSPLREEAMRAMREISSAVRSIEHVAEYLQRHPEALIRGKGKPGED
jgi:paraquat-inducible protein B